MVLIPASHQIGEWRLLSGGVSRATYSDAYDRWKYYGHATRFLHESELEGNLYNTYFMGGFLGYWLSPRLRVFIDGALLVPPSVMTDYLAVQRNDGGPRYPDTGALLDDYEVDVYLGIGFPARPLANRPWRHTARHLEGNPDWMLVFRNLDSRPSRPDDRDPWPRRREVSRTRNGRTRPLRSARLARGGGRRRSTRRGP